MSLWNTEGMTSSANHPESSLKLGEILKVVSQRVGAFPKDMVDWIFCVAGVQSMLSTWAYIGQSSKQLSLHMARGTGGTDQRQKYT